MTPPFRYFADTYNGTESVNMHDYAAAGHCLIALKASEGRSFIDPVHARRSREAHAMGLSVLHYHFARPDEGNNPELEAHLFAMVVKPTWQPGDYLWLDYERDITHSSLPAKRWVEIFCRVVHEHLGATPILYAEASRMNGELADVRITGERYHPAKYGGAPTRLSRRRTKWGEQFTNGVEGDHPHAAAGIGQCDMNLLNARVAWSLRVRTGLRRWRALHPRGHRKVVKPA